MDTEPNRGRGLPGAGMDLAGRLALVTGGSSGIGHAIAVVLAGAGARIVLVARDPARLRSAAEAMGPDAATVVADLAERDGVEGMLDRVLAAHGEPDIVVNAAGVNPRPHMDDLTVAEWDLTMRVNLDAPFLTGRRLGPRMAERGWGRIIHLASQQSIRAFGASGAYGVSKAAVCALARSQAEAWSARGVCVNAIAPGFIRTPLSEPAFRIPGRAELAARTMIGRNGEPEDVAGAALLLASDAGRYITGQTIFVDGGFSVT